MNHISKLAIIKGGESAVDPEILHPDTDAFASLSCEVVAATLGLVQLLGYHLRWHKSTIFLVTYITCVLAGEDRIVSLSQAKLGAIFYPRQTRKDQKKSAKRMIMIALTDMQASGCVAFHLKPGKIAGLQMVGEGKNRRADLRNVGADQWVHSEYTQGVIHLFLAQVQDRARKDDLFSFEADDRNRRLYSIVQSVSIDMGFRPIEQAPDEGEDSPAKRKGKERVRRVTKRSLELGLEEWGTEGFELGQDALNLKLALPVIDSKLSMHATEARVRLKDAAGRRRGQSLPPDAAVRSRGRIGLESAIAGLEQAMTAAEQLRLVKYRDYLKGIIAKLNEGRERAFSNKTGVKQ